MGQRFVFALEPLLEERRRAQDLAQHAFARARVACARGAHELETVTEASRASGDALHQCAASGSSADRYARGLYEERLRVLERSAASQIARNAHSRAELEEASAQLLAARRRCAVLERLRERRLAEFNAAQAKRDETELEEANARRGRAGAER
ncbi:MAG TPA: flagellar FliJ family protein [Candidatus Cybelea sp.]|jgi:flagellar export protein FliJ|nr:flagellar FliJ family protein [Candidatus Cybelea sp.]